jgi:ATP-dependent exoDNAse (exonuclease V) beta subunit
VAKSSPLLSFPDFTLVSASAGSGKTYALALRYVSLLLADSVPTNDLSNVLAITFTNNAAAEMRQRILRFLKLLCVGKDDELLANVMGQTGLASLEVRRRSCATVTLLLEHFSDFQVRTIDSFLARMVKASALDLGIPPDFELQLDPRSVIDYAFELFGATLRPGEPATRAMMQLAEDLAVRHGGDARVLWDPFAEVREGVGSLLGRLAPVLKPLIQSANADDLRHRVRELEEIAGGVEQFIAQHDLPVTSLFGTDLTLVVSGNWRGMLTRTSREGKYTKKGKAAQEVALTRHGEELARQVKAFYMSLSDVVETAARFDARPFADALATLAHFLEAARAVSRRFGFEDLTRRLVTYLETGAVPDVYLMLGESLAHFLIDEFQDTSPLQWAAFHPLLENALASGGSLFIVGDTKQSIFGFRGADWRIMQRLATGEESFPSVPARPLMLDENRRSGEAIVECVASIFESMYSNGGADAEAIAQSGLHLCRQRTLADNLGKGYVEYLRLDGNGDSTAERDAIVNIIRDAVTRGYAYGEIALITPGNEGVVQVGTWLNRAAIPFISHSTLDIRARRVIGELLAFLRFLDTPVDTLSFATFLLGEVFAATLRTRNVTGATETLHQFSARARLQDASPLYRRFREEFPDVWGEYFAPLFTGVGHLPLYDLVCSAYKTFGVFTLFPQEEGALLKMLEVVNGFEQDGDNSLKEFLVFAAGGSGEDEAAWTLDPPVRTAVTLMTIHKAKGMEFPVVIVLYYDTHVRSPGYAIADRGDSVEMVRVNSAMAAWSPALKSLYDRAMRDVLTDLFNRLYVAMTRAEKECYLITVGDPQKHQGFPSRVLSIAESAGKKPSVAPKKGERERAGPQGVAPLHVTEQSNTTVAARIRLGYWATQRGDVVHSILAGLEYVPDPEKALVPALHGLPPTEWAELRSSLVGFLSLPEILPLFAEKPGRLVLNEQEYVARGGNLLRADRIVIDQSEVTVVDFKTGAVEDEEEYVQQIRRYVDIMRDIYPGRVVHGVIAYVDRRVIRRVS